jgi:hypothetical protein
MASMTRNAMLSMIGTSTGGPTRYRLGMSSWGRMTATMATSGHV